MDSDPDPETRRELLRVIAKSDSGDRSAHAAFTAAFSTRLTFGTARIRGRLGFGPGAINRVVVSQASAAMARLLTLRAGTGPNPLRVVVGHDARRNSAVFAQDSAEVLSGEGIEVALTPSHVPTPIVAFTVRHLICDAGTMITASDNPASDNGYRVYLGGLDAGSQIIPTVNRKIEA